jgi:hypothetical protein
MANTTSNRLVKYPWLNLVNQLLGLILFSEWIVLMNLSFFSPDPFVKRIQAIMAASSYNFLNNIYYQIASHLSWLSYIASVFLLVVSVLMILRIYRLVVNWCGVAIAFIYVSAHVTYPGTWLFEYAAPFVFMVILALSTHYDRKLPTLKSKVLGFHCLDIMPSGLAIIVGLVYSLCVFYFLVVSESAGHASQVVGLETSIAFFILFVIAEVLNRYRLSQSEYNQQHEQYLAWMNYHWLDYLLMSLGIILICQVVMDQQLNWFSASGYHDLINVYAQSSDSPLFVRHFLSWASMQSTWLAPVQQAIEFFLAIGAVLLVYRFPVALGIFGLCAMLAFSEFGVPSTWPPTASSGVTWTWELLSITLVAGIIALYQMTIWFYADNASQRIMGEGMFSNLSFWEGILIAFFISISVSIYILLTHSLKALNHAFAIQSGLSCFLFLSLPVAIDRVRKKSDNESLFFSKV